MKSFTIPVMLALGLGALVSTAAQKRPLSGTVPAIVAQRRIAPSSRLAETNQLRLAISLPLCNQAALTNLIREIYDRSSTNFHHYLTPGQFAEKFGPSKTDYEAVKAYALSHGLSISATHPNRLILDVTGAVPQVEQALHVTMHNYSHPTENRMFYAPDAEPTLDLSVPVLHVGGLDNFSVPHPGSITAPRRAAGVKPNDGSGTNGTLYAFKFRDAYAPDTLLQGTGQSVGLVEFDGYDPSDINAFVVQNAYPSPGITLTNVLLDNFDGNPTGAEGEVCLDIEMAMSMAPGLTAVIVYEGGPAGSFPDVLNRMATDNLASQLSCSWFQGGGPADPACEAIFLEMAAQGQSFFQASGDFDAYTGLISFPQDNPYVTLTGGTSLFPSVQGGYGSETVWNWRDGHGSGGGISTQYPIPTWQAGVNMTTNGGSTTMRNVPDVALTADNIAVWVDGGITVMAGTSCAAPLWAGFDALVNERAAQLGQPPVGFVNPALYAIAASGITNAFHDITAGDNTSSSSPENFYAVPGYDLSTGLGTPNGSALINALVIPDHLGVSPQFVSSSGQAGGPFSPASWVITLTNGGSSNLNWYVNGAPAWLAVPVTNGTLPGHGSTNFNVHLNGARTLPFGIYNAQLLVNNSNSPGAQSLAVSLTIRQSLVQNGGFESGDFTGWLLEGDTIMANAVYDSVENGSFRGVVHSGIYGALMGESGFLASITQTLPTASNQLYQLSFWLDNEGAGTGEQFTASWNGTNLVDLVDPATLAWTNYVYFVTASGTNSYLQFSAENDDAYFGLDDVNVFPVPAVKIANVSASGSHVNLGWNSLAGLVYQVQSTTNLFPASWQTLATVIAATNTAGFTDTNAVVAGGRRYYRLALVL